MWRPKIVEMTHVIYLRSVDLIFTLPISVLSRIPSGALPDLLIFCTQFFAHCDPST